MFVQLSDSRVDAVPVLFKIFFSFIFSLSHQMSDANDPRTPWIWFIDGFQIPRCVTSVRGKPACCASSNSGGASPLQLIKRPPYLAYTANILVSIPASQSRNNVLQALSLSIWLRIAGLLQYIASWWEAVQQQFKFKGTVERASRLKAYR